MKPTINHGSLICELFAVEALQCKRFFRKTAQVATVGLKECRTVSSKRKTTGYLFGGIAKSRKFRRIILHQDSAN